MGAWLFFLCWLLSYSGETGLRARIAADAAKARGRVGVACALPGVALECDFNSKAQLPMQSVYKFPIAMAVFDAIERGKLDLDAEVWFLPSDLISPGQGSPLRDAHPNANVKVSVRELLRLAVSDSDGVASDILLRILGGPEVADAYVRSLGIAGIAIRDTEKSLGRELGAQYRNYAEPVALVQLLRRLADQSPLTPEHTKLLEQWMTEATPGPRRLKGLLPAGTAVAHKTGTSGTDGGVTHATNDIGLITLPDGRRLAVAVLVADSPETVAVRERVIAEIAKKIWDAVR